MIRVSVLYPESEGMTFDMPYYLDSHMPMVRDKLGSALLKDEIWKGIGAPGDQPATYRVLLHMYFDSPESFNTAFGAHAGTIMADIANYTNTQPVVELEAGI